MAGRAEVYTFTAAELAQSPVYRITVEATFEPSGDHCTMTMSLAGETVSLHAYRHRRTKTEYAIVREALGVRIGPLRYAVENLGREIELLSPGTSLLSVNYGALTGELTMWLRHFQASFEARVRVGSPRIGNFSAPRSPARARYRYADNFARAHKRWEARYSRAALERALAQLAEPILDCRTRIMRVMPPGDDIELI